jgi:uncharacterized protein
MMRTPTTTGRGSSHLKKNSHWIRETAGFVKTSLEGAEGGHGWSHTERVWRMARYIREQEGHGDLLTIELAALLHDIADPKFNNGDEEEGGRVAVRFLEGLGVDGEQTGHVEKIIRHVSFSSIEFMIVQDADRLDAMGAVGIARAFNYGGYKNRPIHDPSVPTREYRDTREYRASNAPTINHFHEKLLKLKELMNTATGKALARERHDYMVRFLEQFDRECNPFKTGNSG